MTDEAPAPERPVKEIEFHGRKMWVTAPRPEQLLVWQRTLKRLQDPAVDASSWTGDEVMASLERLRKILDSLVLHKADVDWIDDAFLDGTLTFQTTAPLITLAVEAFAADDNRETRRAKKAAVKKATRKRAA